MGCDLSPDVHSVKASPYSSTTWNNASGRPLAILAGLRDFEPDHIIHEDRLGLCLALDSAVGDEAGKGFPRACAIPVSVRDLGLANGSGDCLCRSPPAQPPAARRSTCRLRRMRGAPEIKASQGASFVSSRSETESV